jgi:hypothetical protein
MADARHQSHLRCTGLHVQFPDGRQALVVQIDIDCPQCGTFALQLAGHHLRTVRDALVEMIDLHPTLTGKDEDVTHVSRITGSAPGGDPSLN